MRTSNVAGRGRSIVVHSYDCNRGVFDTPDYCQSRQPPSLSTVRHAMRIAECMHSQEHREIYCANLGIDYNMAVKYYTTVIELEQAMKRPAIDASKRHFPQSLPPLLPRPTICPSPPRSATKISRRQLNRKQAQQPGNPTTPKQARNPTTPEHHVDIGIFFWIMQYMLHIMVADDH